MAEAIRANVCAGSRRRSKSTKSTNKKNESSTIADLLVTVSPVLMVSSSRASLPTTSTWYPVVPSKRPQASTATQTNDDGNAKAAAKKRKRLGQTKMKRDRIQQEILVSCRKDRNLEAQLKATNKRLSKLQGAQTKRPTAKQVWTHCVTV